LGFKIEQCLENQALVNRVRKMNGVHFLSPFFRDRTLPLMGIAERKQRERRQRQNDILESARKLFEVKGFLNTTLNDVAQAAEVSVGLIYRYFESKEDIFASLALKGAEEFDRRVAEILKNAQGKDASVSLVLEKIAHDFFHFYKTYGEYFDHLMYLYKGTKNVQIRGYTLTRMMSLTLRSLDRLKDFFVQHPLVRIQDEEEAMQVVFFLWGLLLGCHKLFDSVGRGHLFAFDQQVFIKNVVRTVLEGMQHPEALSKKHPKTKKTKVPLTSHPSRLNV